MQVIILAAGQSRRFKEAGYAIPKPFIQVAWRGASQPMLQYVLDTVPVGIECITIAVPSGWGAGAHGMIRYEDILTLNIIELEPTKGPADTLLQTLEKEDYTVIHSESHLIMDVDIINSTNDLLWLSQTRQCGVLVKRSNNPAYCYVDNLGSFRHIKEKERISEYAVQGAYFIPANLMSKFCAQLEETVNSEQEPFISHVLDRLPFDKYSVKTRYDPIDWGTPRELELSGARIES